MESDSSHIYVNTDEDTIFIASDAEKEQKLEQHSSKASKDQQKRF